MGGGFEASQAFSGALGDIVLIPESLNSTEIEEIYNGSMATGSIVSRTSVTVHGNIESFYLVVRGKVQ